MQKNDGKKKYKNVVKSIKSKNQQQQQQEQQQIKN